MRTKHFFANVAGKALALAATVMMMSAAFTSCSKDSDDDNGGLPTPKAQTVTFDGEEIKIEKANLTKINEDTYWLGLTLEAGKEATDVIIALEPLNHNGKQIDLTKQKSTSEGGWAVTVLKGNKWLCCGGEAKSDDYKFSSGTMTLNVDPTTKKAEVRLTGGKITTPAGSFGDGKEHTLAIGYSGRMMIMMEYVNLGLPSGIMWAKCNLGASKPSDYGNYYAWGEIEPNKTNYSWATYKWMQPGQSDQKYITKYTFDDGKTEGIWYDAGGNFIGDNKKTLEAADDAATADLGLPWRMPTTDEIKELIDNCTWTWTTQDGKNGYEVKGPNGNSIFLPATGYYLGSDLIYAGSWGYYWSSSLSTAGSYYARSLTFGSNGRSWGYSIRYIGSSVRPVRP